MTFLQNHREAIAAMDFFTVPTLTFGILYCFFVIAHDRRRILHCNVTRNPQAAWVAIQLRETWEEGNEAQRFLLFDRDSKFSADGNATVKVLGWRPLRTAFRSPWQNGVAERWVGSVRRNLLDHIIPLHERHLRRLQPSTLAITTTIERISDWRNILLLVELERSVHQQKSAWRRYPDSAKHLQVFRGVD